MMSQLTALMGMVIVINNDTGAVSCCVGCNSSCVHCSDGSSDQYSPGVILVVRSREKCGTVLHSILSIEW